MLLLADWAAQAQDKSAAPLPKIMPPAGAVRVRIPLSEQGTGFCHFAARLPLPARNKLHSPGKSTSNVSADTAREIDIQVVFDVRPGRSVVSLKKWLQWGFERPPAGQKALLPQLLIPAVQLLPKPQQHHDAWIRLSHIPIEVIDTPGDVDTIVGSDLLLSVSDLTHHGEHRWLPHLHFGQLYLDLTVPVRQIHYPGTSVQYRIDAKPVGEDQRQAVAAVISPVGLPILTYVALNGKDRYPLPDGQLMPVRAVIASVLNCPGGIAMTMGTARGCGVELTEHKLPGQGIGFKTTIVRGRLHELRLEVFVAPDYTKKRDMVLKDLEVWVDSEDSDHLVWLGSQFWRRYFADPVYACHTTRHWKLYGRVNPALLVDPKSRPILSKP
jgi:hypothetical protein